MGSSSQICQGKTRAIYFQGQKISFKTDHAPAVVSLKKAIADEKKARFRTIADHMFAAAGAHPGAGIPGVLSSAKVVESLLK